MLNKLFNLNRLNRSAWKTMTAAAGALGMLLFVLQRTQAQDAGQQPGYEPSAQMQDGADPPSQVGRICVTLGNVSVEPASVSQFSAAEVNYPLTTGDRLYVDTGSLTEVQTRQVALRAGQMTDVTLTAVTDTLTQFGLAQGSVHLHSFGLDPGTTLELDTPNVAVTVLQPGDLRVDVDAANDTTVVTVLAGQAQVNGNGLELVMQPGESLLLSGSNPVSAQNVRPPRPDALDRFSTDRDGVYAGEAGESQYLNTETIGAEDLAGYGSWDQDPDYGAVWYPSGVAVDWQPYRFGHWTWIAPWGWTWVEAEPWGFAPFHYGRWYRRGDRWGWIPGPVFVRPVYSPALVVFVGGGGFAGGVTAWFPLGPRETYVPWYHASPLYMNRVNVTNIYSRDQSAVRNIYSQRTTNVYGNVDNHGYANRGVATVAMEQRNFAAGQRADRVAVHLDAGQVAAAPVLPHPLVTPERSMVTGSPARAVPPQMERPTLASHEDTAVRAGGTVPPRGAAMTNQPAPVTRPATQPSQPQPVQRPTTSYREPIQQQTQPAVQQQEQPQQQRPTTSYRQPIQQQTQPSVAQPQEQVPAASQTARPLFNKAVPPEPRPSFDQQRQAIQETDPGRPLSPQQLNNIRQSQPVGQPQQHEAPHPPAPAPAKSTPPPAKSSPPPPPANKRQ